MPRIVRKVRPGAPPGALTTPRQRVDKVEIEVVCYDLQGVRELEVDTIEQAFAAIEESGVTWINVVGLHDVEQLHKLGHHFGIHPLALEDVVNVGQRPAMHEYDDHLYVILRLPILGESLEIEQISVFFGRGIVITLQEVPGDPWDPVREAIRGGGGNVRRLGADYLAYRLIDSVIDSLYPILETYGERIEELEQSLLQGADAAILGDVQRIKHDLLWIRRTAWPHRELASQLERTDNPLITAATREYLRDLYEHCVQLMDVTDTFRELARGLTDLYMSTASNRMNEVMKVLTIMASIFIPLTFIAGVYGMNFNPNSSSFNMPELNWAWGYPLALGSMAAIAVGMVVFFKLKRWL